MKNKILFLLFAMLLFVSCGKKEVEKIEKTAKVEKKVEIEEKQKIEKEVVEEPEKEEITKEEEEEPNPLSKYISDEVYEEGREIFYGKNENMFTENADQFSGNYEEFKKHIETNFKVTMLATQGGKSSAVLYYSTEKGMKRAIVDGVRIIRIGEDVYYVKAFKDRVEIKQGERGRAVSLYLRKRW